MKVVQWAKSAPDWRRASKGLCIEGECTNRRCETYGEQVIVSRGFSKFDLQVDGGHAEGQGLERHAVCPCPMCGEHVVPLTVAFNSCYWRWQGAKQTGGGREEVSAVD